MNAQRSTYSDGTEKYRVGSSYIAFITKEEYEEILAEVGREVHLRDNAYIVYMRNCSKETLSKWANYVLKSPFHKDKKLENYDQQIQELERQLREGWTVQDFINELTSTIRMIMTGNSYIKKFTTKAELKKWLKDNQPYYKKDIPEVLEHFSTLYNLY